ncbi:MAG: radical SAM protein [Candidatus Bathyarchaeota archaeon]|nr:radical SAM protein [Candidatus Bathyarchaeota archaeon]MDH5791480.1 radical SAM protein [Candidatus Bathyarchaeota archaeon]
MSDARLFEALDLFRRKRRLGYIQVGASSQCTLGCVMCPRTRFPDAWSSADMPPETYERIARSFPDARNVYLSGWGEPLLNAHFLDMVGSAKEAGCTVGFTTNGERLDEGAMRGLVELGADLTGVSLAGAAPGTHGSRRRGSDLNGVFSRIARLNAIKEEAGSDKPRVLLFFMMLKDNMEELLDCVERAAGLGADGVVATNLDYVGDQAQDGLKAFSCGAPTEGLAEKVSEAGGLAERLGVYFRAFPFEMSRVRVCSEDPINNLYVSEGGDVYPCVYLGLPMVRIPRIFCGSRTVLPRVSFGNVNERSLLDIWEDEAYASFRGRYEARLKENDPDPSSLPEVCRTCYKAYGV